MYQEKEPVSEYQYRYIFNHKFNLSFGRPFQGTCKECDRLDMQIKSTGGEEEDSLEPHNRQAAHLLTGPIFSSVFSIMTF
jgi:hypothetical protein